MEMQIVPAVALSTVNRSKGTRSVRPGCTPSSPFVCPAAAIRNTKHSSASTALPQRVQIKSVRWA